MAESAERQDPFRRFFRIRPLDPLQQRGQRVQRRPRAQRERRAPRSRASRDNRATRESGEVEKGHKDRLHPVAPEFAEFLMATPGAERHGSVFRPAPLLPGRSRRLGMQQVGRVISSVGKAAKVKVAEKSGVVKFASAHDLRRSFGERWAPRVMPQVLMELMRHESIDTTLKFYVGRNAEATAAALYAAVSGTPSGTRTSSQGNSFGNTSRFASSSAQVQIDASP